jgi:ATP-binding cassette, subfamily B, bacterial MsbA
MNLSLSLEKITALFGRVYGKNFYNKLYLLIFLTGLISGFEIAGALLLAPIFNMLASQEIKDIFLHNYLSAYIDTYTLALIYSLVIFLLANIFKNIFTILYMNISTILRLDFTKSLRNLVLDNIMTNFYKLDKKITHNIGELNNITILETYNINTSIAALLALINSLLISMFLMVYLLYIDFINTLIILISVFFVIFINKYFFQKVGFYSQKASIQRGVLSGVFNEIIRNIKLVYTKNAYDYEMNRFSRNNSLDKDITQKRDFFTNYSGPITEILSMVIMVFTIYMVTGNSTKIGESITYIYVIFRLMPYIKMINNNKVQLVSSLGAIDNILHYTNDTSKDMDDGNNKSIGKIIDIDIKDLIFSYDGKTKVLDNFNLKLTQGDVVEIIGQSGSGKSTFFDIMLKLRDEYSGNILINSIELRDISKKSWYSKIGYVPQEALLFDESLAYNVAYPNKIDEDKVIDSLTKASLYQYLDNINYQVGENGSKLSGGQKQRVSIARALYNNPDMILFDETTSALDKDTEKNVVEAINSLPNDLIVLLVTHRELDARYTKKINFKV